ncbi:type II toxin-antitoxin system VapC family toxin [Marisediminicola senii]|uniref:type II toxin-antitoxin system VapC family toxin n=1 Tax=Marisediminicola senii TaxID=2711233 RepID=UPI0013ED3319|nr:type II toxin-antitoxin system VapC family toxin [Marisediminicola senii]
MSAPRFVVDASAVVLLLTHPAAVGSSIASKLSGAELHAPDHLPIEVTNVLRRRRNSGSLSETEALLAVDGFWSLPIELWPFRVLAQRSWLLGHNMSTYDAAYVALAERLDATLITADQRLARAPGSTCAFDVVGT